MLDHWTKLAAFLLCAAWSSGVVEGGTRSHVGLGTNDHLLTILCSATAIVSVVGLGARVVLSSDCALSRCLGVCKRTCVAWRLFDLSCGGVRLGAYIFFWVFYAVRHLRRLNVLLACVSDLFDLVLVPRTRWPLVSGSTSRS